jgi:hypothetical protein
MQLSPQEFSLTQYNQQQVYDIIQSGLLFFYDDCSVANTSWKSRRCAFKLQVGNFTKRMAHCF